MTTSRSNPVLPNPCAASPEEAQNWDNVRELFEQVFPKVGCATENWRMTNSLYPSHPDYPSCPALTDLCTVAVVVGSENFTVLMPCPRNRDPNIETGDSVMFQLDFDKNALYMGGHDDPIGTVKWFHGKTTEVPRGWYWITNSAPGSYNTRTGRYAEGFGKYPKNYWDNPGGTDPALGTLGLHCDGNDAALSIDDHIVVPDVTVQPHAPEVTTTELTGITATINCDNSYVAEDCVTGLYGYVDISHHDHFIDVTTTCAELGVNYPGSTPVSVPGCVDLCTEEATTPPCGSTLPPVPVGVYGGCHDHYLYMDCDLTLNDPGHFHETPELGHDVDINPQTLVHSYSLTQMTLPRVYFLLIERLNNSANVAGSPSAAGVLCSAATAP